jgi:hypothetical protein
MSELGIREGLYIKCGTKFARSTKDLLVSFPTMEAMATAVYRQRVHEELGDFDSRVNYLENLVDHTLRRDYSDLTQETAKGFIDYVSMQIGLDNDGEDFAPLTWLALVILLRGYGAPYPRQLIASFEHFHSIWDVERFLGPASKSSRDTRYPRYVADYIRSLTAVGRKLIDVTKLTDVY